MKLQVILATGLALFMSVMAFNYIFGDMYTYHGVVVEPPQPAADFVLTDVETGQPFHFEQEHSEVSLLYFGYTQCPDVCPTTMGDWKRIKQALGPDAGRVRFIFITVDPERDTPEILANYMNVFDDSFIGLSGQPETISNIVAEYGIWVAKENYDDTALGYVVNHTASTLLVDKQGAVRVQYPFGTPAKDMLADINYLLR